RDQVGDEAEALRILERNWNSLQRTAPLSLTTATFCSSAEGFGRFTPIRVREFRAGQQVAIYCELDNFECRSLADTRYSVAVHVDFDILIPGPTDRAVEIDNPERYVRDQEWVTARPIHDLWFGLRIRLPKGLIPGPYVLRLTVHDAQSEKRTEARIPFYVK
ncbi:MAG: hypothetical protein HZA54_07890, partial [Planctomycetes bacterium]|nr:hypothetical protein [Planctomycetota bacterium]